MNAFIAKVFINFKCLYFMCFLTIFLKCNSMSNEFNKNQDFTSYILFYFYINLFLLYIQMYWFMMDINHKQTKI